MRAEDIVQGLVQVVEAAINAGDWKVDGACDPSRVLKSAKEYLAAIEEDEGGWPSVEDIVNEADWTGYD